MQSSSRTALLHVALAAGYGVLTHAAFRSELLYGRLNVMSAGFLFLAPFAIGLIAAPRTRRRTRFDWRYVLYMPWLACLAVVGAGAVFAHEPLLCIVMALPVVLAMASLGSIGPYFFSRLRMNGGFLQVSTVVAAMLAPYFVAYAESFAPPSDSMRKVHTEIDIKADKSIIWQNITRVAEIQPKEHRFSVFHTLGLPRPREAVLSRDGVGGVRDAMFEQGLNFVETVTHWQDQQELRFTIEVDHSKSLPPLIGAIEGVYFRVLEGRYAIEPLPHGSVRLHLDSAERLGTRFNWYAGLWTDSIMHHLQEYILRIVKERCEKQAAMRKTS